ncbi:MAG TPA: hypothetical protein DIU35_05580 [Candidatus Latescibacteria bacterium]|nr:hypothetical protein [Candidatus Latescibacterota bacterium]
MTPKFPTRHPYLLITVEEIAQVHSRAQAEPWAKKALDRILDAADRVLAEPPDIPEGVSADHRGVSSAAKDVALAYALSGEERYRKYSRKVLLHYAEVYTSFPLVRNKRSRLTSFSSLYESRWYIPLVYAYDLLYESLSSVERERVEAGIVRPGLDCFVVWDYGTDPRATDWHYRCYNFQAWHLAAIGLAGFCLQDQKLIDYALESRFGFRHHIGHDINDDGLFWERALGYHQFTLSAFLDLTEAAYRCGMDLYTLEVSDTYGPSDDIRELNYPVDGDNGPKTLKMMFDAPFYYPFPDGSTANIGDSSMQMFLGHPLYRIGYARCKDPKYAWLIEHKGYGPDLTALIHGLPGKGIPAPVLGTGRFGNTGRTVLGSTLYPATGYAILRQDELDRDATCVLLNYGPFGGGHGHPDQLNMVLYSDGKQWIRDFGSFSYNGHPMKLKGEWTAQTVSHSTLTVDGISQHPQGDRDSAWPSDDIASPANGELQTFEVDSLLKVASASCDRVYDGVRLERTLALFDGLVVDFYRAESDAAHQYDWVMHVDGAPDAISVPLAQSEIPLGERCGYQHIKDVERAKVNVDWTAGWRDDEGRGLRITLLGEPGTEAIRARSMTNRGDEFASTLIARRNATNTVFAAFLEPYRGESRIMNVKRLPAETPDEGIAHAVGVEIQTVDGVRYVLLTSDGDTRHLFGELVFAGELALIKLSEDETTVSVVGARYLNFEGKEHAFDIPTKKQFRME